MVCATLGPATACRSSTSTVIRSSLAARLIALTKSLNSTSPCSSCINASKGSSGERFSTIKPDGATTSAVFSGISSGAAPLKPITKLVTKTPKNNSGINTVMTRLRPVKNRQIPPKKPRIIPPRAMSVLTSFSAVRTAGGTQLAPPESYIQGCHYE